MAADDATESFFGEPVTWRAEAARALGITDADLPAAISPGASFPAALRTIVAALPSPVQTIVNVGSGAGGDSEFLRRATGATVHAVEPSDLARQSAHRSFPLIEQVQGDATNTGLPEGEADAVVMCGLLSLVDDASPVFKEAIRVLKPDGRVAIADLFAAADDDLRSDPNVFRTPQSVIALGTAHGLKLIDVAVGEPTPDENWSAIAGRVDAWIEAHCVDRPGFDAWCGDRAHLAEHIDNGDVVGGCVIFAR